MNKANVFWFSFFSILCVCLFLADILSGSVSIPFNSVINTLLGENTEDSWKSILLDYRIPKACTAAIAGAGLAVCGLQLQTLFRNPLAGPDVLGISSGASLGVALSIMVSGAEVLSMGGFNTQFGAVFSAGMGAMASLLLIMLISFRIRDHITILIIGLMIAQLSGAVQGLLQYFSRASEIQGFVLWGMGSFANVSGNGLGILFAAVISGMLISIFASKYLNVILLGEKYAQSMGLNLRTLRILIILSTAIITGTITAYCGPIAFIGIAVPHITKGLLKITDHLLLIPAVALCGAVLSLFCDVLAHLPFFQTALPVNIITSIIGAPIVIWVIMKQRNIRRAA